MGTTTSLPSQSLVSNLVSSYDSQITVEQIGKELSHIKQDSLKGYAPIEARAAKYINRLHVPSDQLKLMVESFVNELQVGLELHKINPYKWDPKACSFKMLDSCIANVPTGQEKGSYYAMDFGGSNFRIARATLKGDSKIDLDIKTIPLNNITSQTSTKSYLTSATTAKELFDMFSQKMYELAQELHPGPITSNNSLPVGFTFSFPCTQKAINRATLVYWTKEITTGRGTNDPVEGLDAVELLNAAFIRNKIPMHCNVVLNDTVATLFAAAYEVDMAKHPPCLIGLIAGTGVNCCYFDESAPLYGYHGKVINLECGNFNIHLPRINIDFELDFKAVETRGWQLLEKMTSCAYLGELCRLALVRVFAEHTPPMAWQAHTLTTEILTRIVEDQTEDYAVTSKEVQKLWQVEMPVEQLIILHKLANAILDRSAAIVSVIVAGCAIKTGRLKPAFGGMTVGVDGALFQNNTFYQVRIKHHLTQILGEELASLVYFEGVFEGSVKGAAVVSAIEHLRSSSNATTG